MQRLAARPLGTFLTVLVMGFALALPLAFWLVLGNVQQLTGTLGRAQALNVFMQSDAGADRAATLAGRLRKRADIAKVTVKTPAEGRRELASLQGFAQALDALDSNPLPYVLLIEPRAHASAQTVAVWPRTCARCRASIRCATMAPGANAWMRCSMSAGAWPSPWRCYWRWRRCWSSATACAWIFKAGPRN
jgi:hypothetical protein